MVDNICGLYYLPGLRAYSSSIDILSCIAHVKTRSWPVEIQAQTRSRAAPAQHMGRSFCRLLLLDLCRQSALFWWMESSAMGAAGTDIGTS